MILLSNIAFIMAEVPKVSNEAWCIMVACLLLTALLFFQKTRTIGAVASLVYLCCTVGTYAHPISLMVPMMAVGVWLYEARGSSPG